jgi:hypothetical protein
MSIEVGSLFVFRGEKFIVQSLNESSIRVLDEGDILLRYLKEEIIGKLTSRWPTFVDWNRYFNYIIDSYRKNWCEEELQQFSNLCAEKEWDKLEHIIPQQGIFSREDLISEVLQEYLGFYHFEDRPKTYYRYGVEDEWIIFPSCDGLMDKRFDGSDDDYFDEEDRFAVIC